MASPRCDRRSAGQLRTAFTASKPRRAASSVGGQKYLQPVAKRIARGEVLYAARADGDVPRAEVLRAVTALRERGLVVRTGRGRYEFLEPMFADFVRRLDAAAAIVPAR